MEEYTTKSFYGVVSLLDMMEIYASFFVEATNKFVAWERLSAASPAENEIKPEWIAQLFSEIGAFGVLCASHGFKSSTQQCNRIALEIKAKRVLKCGDIETRLGELRRRFEDELKELPFFQLSPQELTLYKSPRAGWETITDRFPKTAIDIDECSRCFAFGRYGAALFHVLLVAEYGVIALAKLLGVEGDKPGWGALERLEKLSSKPYKDRSSLEQQYSKILDSMMPFAHSMKNEWRHKINHVENKIEWVDTDFSPQMAANIIGSVRGFMDKLAFSLPNAEIKKPR
jgi:hypothetical protein